MREGLKARWVLPVEGPPIEEGVVVVEGDRIAAVGRESRGALVCDLGNVALVPGLVNTHTHLEFSHLAAPLGKPGMPLPEWLKAVVDSRQRRAEDAQVRDNTIRRGLAESLSCGVTTLGEIAQPSLNPGAFASTALETIAFIELIGLSSTRIAPLVALAEKHLKSEPADVNVHWQPGVSPHAPYSVHPDVVERVAEIASESPVAMHLAESREELEWLSTGGGPFAKLLGELGVASDWSPRDGRPLDYLKRLAAARHALVVHGNYLEHDELEYVAARRERMSLVYCPRTHAWFGHEPYPLSGALDLGVRVALGTDSRASNPDLSLLEEMRFVAAHHPSVPPQAVLRMGTLEGAAALGRSADLGSIRAGKLANLASIELPAGGGDPYELLLAGNGACCAVWHRGRRVVNHDVG
jgi:cytosine/adenosine deaminase-related metal-dependent hydrolase